jgi:sodium-dependent dicarboxylate transporter 2/3/5
MSKRQLVGLILGLSIFLLVLILPASDQLGTSGKSAAAVALLMAIWWITEVIPIYITALLPLALFPVLSVLDAGETAQNYGNKYVYLLLGGFFIAKAFEVHNLHQRIALIIIRFLGTSRRKIILSFMVATALLSMWIANISVALIMLPIALALISKIPKNGSDDSFGLALMLAIAYAASIGGTGTLIGTPPNLIFVGIIEKLFPAAPEISFLQWMLLGIPLVAVFLPVTWLYLIRYFRIEGNFPGSKKIIDQELHSLGKISIAEKRVLIIFILTALAWIFRKDFQFNDYILYGWASQLGIDHLVHDSTIAIIAAIFMFLIPAGYKPNSGKENIIKLLDWKAASQVPWGVALIVGGGYALAAGFTKTGLADWMGTKLTLIADFPVLLLVMVIIIILTLMTEITSNTATTNIFLPILASMAIASQIHPYLIMIPGTIACSCAFMLPSGTGPNTVIFGSGLVTIPQMARCGLGLNLIGVVIVTMIIYLIGFSVFQMSGGVPDWIR